MKILNRIVTFVLAVAVFPSIVTRVLLRLIVSVAKDSTAYTLLSGFMKETIDSGLEITFSVQDIFDYLRDGSLSFDGMSISFDKLPAEMLVTKNWLIASAVLLVLSLVIALTIMGCALFAQAHKTVMGLGVGGAACCFGAISCFSRFAEPFVAGDVDIGAFLGEILLGDNKIVSSIGSIFMSGAVNVDVLQLGNAVITMAILFIAVTLWTFAYFITLPTEAKPKKAKAAK
ncbi:MAG: hypothetical protein IIU80_04130 [Clostridia bacterium]|nr:hypothetical protein [Clostridia bacterium]